MAANTTDYLDFDVRIQRGENGRHEVEVLRSPYGEPTRLCRELDDDELLRIRARLEALACCSPGVESESAGAALRRSLEGIGTSLFELLFPKDIRDCFLLALGHVESRSAEHKGLRLRLCFQPSAVRDSSLPFLLPWEYLYHTATREFLSLNLLTPIVRYLRCTHPPYDRQLQPPLRLLVVMSNPRGYPRLDQHAELEQLRRAWRRHPNVEVTSLPSATRARLRHKLLGDEPGFHVFHVVGHGEYDRRTATGYLMLESEDGEPDPIAGVQLAALTRNHPTLRLCCLNACRTSQIGSSLEPFSGVATALLDAGLPAAIAMQLPISDAAAVAFSGSLYESLAAGAPLEAAVATARVAVSETEPAEWGIPVLFMGTDSGRLFEWSSRGAAVLHRRVDAKEHAVALSLLQQLPAAECRSVYDELDPDGHSTAADGHTPSRHPRLLQLMARRGSHWWLRAQESILAASHSFTPLERHEREWEFDPPQCWQRGDGGELLGLGQDPGRPPGPGGSELHRSSLATWHGPRFRDARVSLELWLPDLPEVGAAGVLLRWEEDRGGVFALIYKDPTAGTSLELWQGRPPSLRRIATVAVVDAERPDGCYRLCFALSGRDATARVGARAEFRVAARLAADYGPGRFGFVKFNDVAVRIRNLDLCVDRST